MAGIAWGKEESIAAAKLLNDNTYAETAKILNSMFGNDRTGERVRDAYRRGTINRMSEDELATVFDRAPNMKIVQKGDHTTIDANRPFSDEEMAEMFGVDMDEWYITKRVTNTYAGNFHTKLWWEPNELNILASNWDAMLQEVREQAPSVKVHRRKTSGLMYEMLLYDAHIGAKGWGPETGENYDLPISVNRYANAFHSLLDSCPDDVDHIVFVVGQDLFHFDTLIKGKGGATAKGTPQDVDSRWQKLFISVSSLIVDLIKMAADKAGRVVIPVQPGNHDTQTTFYLGEYLDAWFHNDERVFIDNAPKPRKYVRFGEVLLGYTHGDREKSKDLYGLMTEEAGVARWREWHRGHLHQEDCSEDGTMRIRTNPALSGKESWHNEQGYRGIPGARAFLWDRADGIVRQEYYNVPWNESHTNDLGAVITGG